MTRFLMLGAFAVGCGFALPAVAEPPAGDQLRSQAVALSDLNLESHSGAVAAVSRITVAARAVCDQDVYSTRNLRARAVYRSCLDHATETAVASLNAPLVTAAYKDRWGTPGATAPVVTAQK